ncbi:MAG: type I secretion system permease/ATPase [Candidatus Sedimenticola sp. 6PFRAG5]
MLDTCNRIKAALGESRPLFLGAFWFGLFINVLMLAVPLYSLQVLDRVLSSGSTDTLLMLSLITAILLLFMGLLQGFRALVFSHIGRWLDDRLSMDLVRKSAVVAVQRPNIGTQPIRDLATIKRFVISPAMSSAFDAPWAVIYFVVIFMIHVDLGIAVVLGACILLVVALLAERMPAKLSAAANDEQIKSMQALDSVIRNAEVVRSMGLLDNAAARWQRHNQKALGSGFSASNINTVITHSTRTLRMGLQVLLTGLGGYYVLAGEMSAGGIIAVSILSGKALAPFDAAVSIYQSWIGVKKAYGRLVDLDQAVPDHWETTRLPEPQGSLSVEKLTYQDKTSGHWILRGINFSAHPGEAIGIIGPSGAGKTTLARLLVGVLNPTSGAARLDGAALHQWDHEQLGGLIGYLPQGVELFSGTIAENIARLDQEAEDDAVIEAAKTAVVHEAILQLPSGYQTDIGTNGALLSAGQRQRIGLARCFYGGPKLVVLDEPNANLDSEGELALSQCLVNAKRQGITTVTIAHRPSVLQNVDKILVLQHGEAKLFGPTEEVMAQLATGGNKVQPLRPPARTEAGHGE